MRLPNGYGTVYKLNGARRRPWIVRKFHQWQIIDDKSRPIYITIGYAKTKKEALEILSKFNNNPYNLNASNFTFKDVFEKWSERKYKSISESNIHSYNAAFNTCASLHSLKFREITLDDLQNVIDTCGKNYPTLKKIKTLFNQMYKYALKYEYCTKDYSIHVELDAYKDRNPNKYDRTIFSKEDMNNLWLNKHNPYIQMILILIYTGLRVTTLLDLKKIDICLESKVLHVIKDKTECSIRGVPIANEIIPLIEEWMERSPIEYLCCTEEGEHFKYRNYYDSYFKKTLEDFGITPHKPHDCRHTTATLLNNANVPLLNQKLILGHEVKDITQNVYTHVSFDTLLKDINKIHNYIHTL